MDTEEDRLYMDTEEDRLRNAVVQIIQHSSGDIMELEEKLRLDKVTFRRDELRSVIWRLVASQIVTITPESKIVFRGKIT